MNRRAFRGLSMMMISLLCCGCAGRSGELSTNPQGDDEIIHKESTLSTAESTNVDNIEEYTTSNGDSESRTENGKETAEEMTGAAEETAAETEKTEETAEMQTAETEIPKVSEEETMAENTEGTLESEEDALMKEVLSDAAYYYTFYASIYQTRDENTSLRFDREAFQKAYKSILKENLNDYFSDISWLTREDGISLSFTPTERMFPDGNTDVNLWMARCIHAFALTEEAYSTDPNWDHPDSLKPQFHCHTVYARQNKLPWNIEPYRTETSFLKVILSKGNPES